MKKVFLSAFAMSLVLSCASLQALAQVAEEFLGLETELGAPLDGEQKLGKTREQSGIAAPVTLDLAVPVRGQKFSRILWESKGTEDLLSIKSWLIENEHKVHERPAEYNEDFGKILKCVGSCSVYRGSTKASVQHLSRIEEGDELVTDKDSLAWVFLMDGSLLRVSPETSVSFNEFNLSKEEVFLLLRLNHGHLFWNARTSNQYTFDPDPETDSMALPLLIREANLESFEKQIFQKQPDDERLLANLDLDEKALLDQTSALNILRAQNSEALKTPSRLMLIAPNGTVISKNVSLDLAHVFGGKTYLKRRNTQEVGEIELYLRGYNNKEAISVSSTHWHELDPSGRVQIQLQDPPAPLQILELLTKRIRSLELAREIWIAKYVLPIFTLKETPQVLTQNYGYSIWNPEDYSRRIDFLKEYTRRIETTNLRSVENLLSKVEVPGQPPREELSVGLYRASLNHYLLGLKNRYDRKKRRVRQMSDLEYYVWILRNGKF